MKRSTEWNVYIDQWNRSAVRLQYIQCFRSFNGSVPDLSEFGAHTGFFFILTHGEIGVRVADEYYHCRSPYVFHGGENKNTSFEVPDHHPDWAGYLVLYSTWFTSLENQKDVAYTYGFTPTAMLPIQEKCEAMERHWSSNEPLDQLQASSIFLPVVYEVLSQRLQTIALSEGTRLNIVTDAIKYIQAHYRDSITAENLAARYECSTSYLSRLFRNQIDWDRSSI